MSPADHQVAEAKAVLESAGYVVVRNEGRVLRQRREALGYSQLRLGRLAGVSAASVGRVEGNVAGAWRIKSKLLIALMRAEERRRDLRAGLQRALGKA